MRWRRRSGRMGGPRLARIALAVAILALVLSACGSSKKLPAPPPKPTASQASTRPRTQDLADLVAKVRSGVVRIEVSTCAGQAIGTGFLLSPRLVATVEHVVDGATSIELTRSGKFLGSATVIGADAPRDLALVRTNTPIRGYDFHINGRAPRLGEEVVALGFPLGLPLSATRGVVSGSDRTVPIEGIKRRGLVQTDAAINHGNSGGPLIDTRTGQVVGLADLLTTEANGIAFAVSGQVARPLLEAWGVAPQPVSAATCGGGSVTRQAAPPPPSSTPPGSGLATFTGRYFSVAYPSNWDVEAAEVDKGTYLDTTIADPADRSVYLRVDVTPNAPAELGANANPVLQALRRQPGYRELALVRTTFNGYDAIYWEFLVSQAGVVLHKVDIFFIDQYGEGLAVLTQAPAAAWSSWASTFAALRESLSIP